MVEDVGKDRKEGSRLVDEEGSLSRFEDWLEQGWLRLGGGTSRCLGQRGFIICQKVLLGYVEMCLMDVAEVAADVAVVGLDQWLRPIQR